MNNVYIKKALNMNPWIYAIINIITFDYYSLYLQYKLTKILNEVFVNEEFNDLKEKLNQQYKISLFSALTGTLMFIMTLWGVENTIFDTVSDLVWIVCFIFGVMWAFTTRKILRIYVLKEHQVEIDLPGFLLFLFPGIMLITAINDIEINIELKRLRESKNSL